MNATQPVIDSATHAHLVEYLRYMETLGFHGLALPQNPFVKSAPQPAPQRQPAPAKPLPPTTQAKPKAKPSQSIPNVMSILEMVEAATPTNVVAEKIAAMKAEDPLECLRQLYGTFQHCQACALSTTRNRFVFGEGPPNASLMFVGEGPGQVEDSSGKPFDGQVGELLDKIIAAMGFHRAEVFITNVVKCRPPDRSPLPDEVDTCKPILEKQIQVIKPRAIVAFGATALRFFHGIDAPLTRMRGQFISWQGIKVMPTFHPAYILRNPRAKRDVWNDMQKVMAFIRAGS